MSVATISNLRPNFLIHKGNCWTHEFFKESIATISNLRPNFLIHKGNCWTHEFFKESIATIKNVSLIPLKSK